jgi:hypothetical protein
MIDYKHEAKIRAVQEYIGKTIVPCFQNAYYMYFLQGFARGGSATNVPANAALVAALLIPPILSKAEIVHVENDTLSLAWNAMKGIKEHIPHSLLKREKRK